MEIISGWAMMVWQSSRVFSSIIVVINYNFARTINHSLRLKAIGNAMTIFHGLSAGMRCRRNFPANGFDKACENR
jgi:hypothetical protein